ncbi:MAG TPA: hypothetical protein VH087_01330 [Thermoanaerobaculia bacterium]|jgi:hypothetical protein|nr:hypothetical protein [Thermoanaerobaculia bacterium]
MKPTIKLLLIAAVVLAAFGCRSSNPTTLSTETCTGGYLGNADATRPLVCVGTNGPSAMPKVDPVHVYAKGRNGVATQITWASPDPKADLHVTMASASQNCVKNVTCPEKRACFATIVDRAPAGAHCEYQISNGTSAKPADPIIIIDTCCAN